MTLLSQCSILLTCDACASIFLHEDLRDRSKAIPRLMTYELLGYAPFFGPPRFDANRSAGKGCDIRELEIVDDVDQDACASWCHRYSSISFRIVFEIESETVAAHKPSDSGRNRFSLGSNRFIHLIAFNREIEDVNVTG